ALWVIGGFGTRPTTPEWVAWPPQGYVPYQLVYPRWSFARDGGDFANATITMTHKGNPVSLTKLPVDDGYGDNTVVWEPSGIPTTAPSDDLTYAVRVSNVIVSGSPRQYTYNVIIIDPDRVVQTDVRSSAWMGYE
ncbi:hypothetical protein FJY63_14920, partial [Candidatus Sumerlaeota bacterium]|nr:hypothetical protein [Candidatus Sumerlaeota bacterium]